jgi:hypothetical protein
MAKAQGQWHQNTKCNHCWDIHTYQKPMLHDGNIIVCVFQSMLQQPSQMLRKRKGYTMHFELLPSCFPYLCMHGRASLKRPVPPTVGSKYETQNSGI